MCTTIDLFVHHSLFNQHGSLVSMLSTLLAAVPSIGLSWRTHTTPQMAWKFNEYCILYVCFQLGHISALLVCVYSAEDQVWNPCSP